MKNIGILGLVIICFLPLATANIYITEVMHSPTQVSDSEGEWVEIYNSGESSVNLNSWTIDGKSIGNQTINAKEYFILARELLDSSDNGTESFESYWGNNNGIWDESFNATEVSLSLKEEDTIIITDGINSDSFTYNTSFGGKNGKTLERVYLLDWIEGPVDGTPGYGNFSTEEIPETNRNEIYIFIDIENNAPEILFVNMTDDEEKEGIQIIPLLSGEKTIFVNVGVNDTDGLETIQKVSFIFGNTTRNMSLQKNNTDTMGTYTGNFSLSAGMKAGEYNLTIFVEDSENITEREQTFTYEGLVATQLNVTVFNLNMHAGSSETQEVELINNGNVEIDAEITAEDIVSEKQTISRNAISFFDEVWLPLDNPVFVDANIAPQSKKQLQFKIDMPAQVKSGHYEGKISITSKESTND